MIKKEYFNITDLSKYSGISRRTLSATPLNNKAVQTDPKLDEFLHKLKEELFKPEINPGGKLIVFSEAKDTTDYLRERLVASGYSRLLAIEASNRKNLMHAVEANFDGNVPKDKRADEYDILLSTEVLAEGVNLHRANIVVNYDTPWNSIRLMQRIGRVNRIGTKADRIYIYNFFPTANVDSQINLEKRAIIKLQAFHTALGEDSQIYSPEEEFNNFGLFEKAPEEERDEKLEFLDELRRFRRENPSDYKTIRNLPFRARVGRKDKDHEGSTFVFVRNARRNAFYRVNESVDEKSKTALECEELGFIEAAKIFRATVKEIPHPIPSKHHSHVFKAIETFKKQLISEAVQGQNVLHHQPGPNEKKALQLLGALDGLELPDEEEKELLRA